MVMRTNNLFTAAAHVFELPDTRPYLKKAFKKVRCYMANNCLQLNHGLRPCDPKSSTLNGEMPFPPISISPKTSIIENLENGGRGI